MCLMMCTLGQISSLITVVSPALDGSFIICKLAPDLDLEIWSWYTQKGSGSDWNDCEKMCPRNKTLLLQDLILNLVPYVVKQRLIDL